MPPVQMYREVQVDPQNEVQSESSSVANAVSHQRCSFYFPAAAGAVVCRCDLRYEI